MNQQVRNIYIPDIYSVFRLGLSFSYRTDCTYVRQANRLRRRGSSGKCITRCWDLGLPAALYRALPQFSHESPWSLLLKTFSLQPTHPYKNSQVDPACTTNTSNNYKMAYNTWNESKPIIRKSHETNVFIALFVCQCSGIGQLTPFAKKFAQLSTTQTCKKHF